MTVEIAVLLDRARGNDPQAWSQLYDLYYPRIFAFILTRVRDQMLAEDLAADVFLNALKAIAGYQERGAGFAAWLYRIAHNRLIDHYRRASKRNADSLDEYEDSGTSLPNGATTGGGLTGDRIDLHSAIERLAPEQRQIIYLRFIEGLTSDQVAVVMSKTTAAVKIMQHRALKALRATLQGSVPQ